MKEVNKIYDTNANIDNIKIEIKSDNIKTKAKISFNNIGKDTITAIKFNMIGYNSFGDIVEVKDKNSFDLVVQDIQVDKNSNSGDLIVGLPDSNIRKLDLEENQICYADGNVVSYLRENKIQVTLYEYEQDSEYLKALKTKFGEKMKYQPLEIENGWICSCGRYNKKDESDCTNCQNNKNIILKIIEEDTKNHLIEEFKESEKKRIEREIEETKFQKKKKRHNYIKIAIGVFVFFCYSDFYS